MQYLKDEVRNSIAREALKEFMEKGYKGASIRSIARKSNTSVGNMYKYYISKDDLFEKLIGSVYHKIIDYIQCFDKVERNEKAQDIFQQLVDKIMDMFTESNTEIAILLNQSKGSKYENCKVIFVDFITRIVTETLNYDLKKEGKELKDNFIVYLIAYSLVEAIAVIVREKQEDKEVKKLILNLIDIYFTDLIKKVELVNNNDMVNVKDIRNKSIY